MTSSVSMRGQPVRATHAGLVLACVMLMCASPHVTFATDDAPAPVRKAILDAPPEDFCGPLVGHIVNPAWCGLPNDVHRWLLRRHDCDHFRAQPMPTPAADPDGERRRALLAYISDSCDGGDAELARLRAAHRDNTTVIDALSGLADIEPRRESLRQPR